MYIILWRSACKYMAQCTIQCVYCILYTYMVCIRRKKNHIDSWQSIQSVRLKNKFNLCFVKSKFQFGHFVLHLNAPYMLECWIFSYCLQDTRKMNRNSIWNCYSSKYLLSNSSWIVYPLNWLRMASTFYIGP